MNQETIIERIEKLLRLAAAGSGATPAEAESAAAMASKLMFQHQIDEAKLRAKSKQQPVAGDYARETITITKSSVWERELLSWIANVADCYLTARGRWSFEVLGGSSNVQFVKALFVWLRDEFHRQAKAAYKAEKPMNDLATGFDHVDPMRFHTSFKRGAVSAVASRLREQKHEQQAAARRDAEGSAALMVIEDTKKRALVHFYPHMRRSYFPTAEEIAADQALVEAWRARAAEAPPTKQRKIRVSRGRAEREYSANSAAYYRGRTAGDTVRINLNKEIS